jgi:regulation of enolase protein 1 (concanavalin A-like superfamily)
MLQDFIAAEGGNGQITISDQEATITAQARTDWFFHPDGFSRQANVPSLVLETTAPEVSLAAKVSVGFAGIYDAGALFVETGPDHWAKLAFELSPQGFPTIVSVVTKGTSDDCDGPRHPADAVWLRLHVRGGIVAFHFSEDGQFWRFNRTFSLPRSPGAAIRLGLSAQAPTREGCTARFTEVKLRHTPLIDFRDGS